MKNTECTIYITTKHGRTWSYRKANNGWTQTGPTGTVRPLSAEQLLSHILPPLAAGNPDYLSVRAEPDVIGFRPVCQPDRQGKAPAVRAALLAPSEEATEMDRFDAAVRDAGES